MVIIGQLKKHIAGACIFGIAIYKLDYWQEFCLVILFKIDKNLQTSLYDMMLTFYLTFGLRVKRDKKLLLDIKKIANKDQNFKVKNNL